MFKNYLKTAYRNLWKNKTYSFLNIFGLAIGIACAGLIFLWIEDEMSYDEYNAKQERVYQIMEHQAYEGKKYTFAATPGLLGPTLMTEMPGFQHTARATWQQTVLFSLEDKTIFERGFNADSSIFDIFTFEFVQGNKNKAFDQLHSVVISQKMAKKFFGNDNNIIGKTLKVDDADLYAITGVYKDLPENVTFKADWIIPFKNFYNKNDWLQYWGNNGIQTFVEVNENVDIAALNKKLYDYIGSKDTNAVAKAFLFPMKDWRLRNKFEEGKQVGGRIQFVRMFGIIAWVILLIACINFMNLATARSEKRAREVGVRKVMGASKGLLIAQFIGEALFLSFLSLVLAVGIIALLLPLFNTLIEKQLSMNVLAPTHLFSLVSIGLICGLIAGSYPALYLSSFNPVSVFKGLKMKAGGAAFVRKGLVILQFTISIILIISTIIIYQQINHIKSRDMGYNKDHLVQSGLQGNMMRNFAAIKQDLISGGLAENVAMSDLNMLYMGSQTSNFNWDGKEAGKDYLITVDYVSPEYIPTTGLKLASGRNFYADSKQDSGSIIINETLAKLMKKKDVVGSIILRDTAKLTVIGVVKDFVYGDMYGQSDPLVFLCYPDNFGYLYLRIPQSANIEGTMGRIETVIKKYNPGYPFNYIFVDQEFDRQFKSESLIGKLSRVFAILAIIISCLGLFGLSAYTAERRTKEIGIRKVLGASVGGLTRLLSREFLQLVIISAVIAFPIAWWAMHSWLQDFAYRVGINAWIFLVAGLLAIMIALVTVSFQAIRAALSNPVKAIRSE